MKRTALLALTVLGLWIGTARAVNTTVHIGAGDTGLLFGGSDAEGGIGDWYVSNGVIEAIVADAGIQSDLTPLVPGSEPPMTTSIAPSGGNLIDLGLVGADNDQLAEMFTVGGLSTENFIIYTSVSSPLAGVVRATGFLLLPPISTKASPCIDITTDYRALGINPYLEIATTSVNNCGVAGPTFGGFLDVFVWTIRGLVPFSAGGIPPGGGKGFDHPTLDLGNPTAALEFPVFAAAPGQLEPADGLMDTANGTTSGTVSYGIVGVNTVLNFFLVTPINSLFGVTSSLISALGNTPTAGAGGVGANFSYTRRVYVGDRNDVASSANGVIGALATRIPFTTGTISGDVDAADTTDVEASILVQRIGFCVGDAGTTCKVSADCAGGATGPCRDTVPTTGATINGSVARGWNHVRTSTSGAFSGVVLPTGRYELTVSAPERDDVVVSPVIVTASTNTAVAVPPLSARGTVIFEVRERRRGQPLLPAKLVFKGVAPTPDPRFARDLKATLSGSDILPETFGGAQAGSSGEALGQGNVVYTSSGSGAIQVRPGTYDVYAARGSEYNVQVERITVPSGGSTSVGFKLKRALERATRDALSADFHIHSGRSMDTSPPMRDRVAAFAGEGVEVMVSTDHDKRADYAPLIASLGLADRMTSIVGNEITGSSPNPPHFPNSIGHINGWPLTVEKDQRRDGAIEDEFVAPNWVYKRLRDEGVDVIQYNHPRAGVSGITTIGIFNNIGCFRCANDIDMTCSVDGDCPAGPGQDCTCVGYQPDRPITMPPNDILLDTGVLGPGSPSNSPPIANLDFDVMEIANAARDTDFDDLRLVRRDWLSLLNQGIFKPGTGVSDSHRTTVEHAGWARTYVNDVDDDPSVLDVTNFDNQILLGNMVISAGPYIEFSARASGGAKAKIGGLLIAPNGKARLKVKVWSPAWIPVEEVRVIANGFQILSFDETTQPKVKPVPSNFESSGRTRRFSKTLRFDLTEDTYFIIEAGVKIPPLITTLPTPPPIVDIIEPGVVPVAITNPIFVDADGDGMFTPPGLPVMTASASPPAAPGGFWERMWGTLTQVAARLTGREAVADDMPGEMTGVTKERKEEAVREGEYFPLHEFRLPGESVEELRQKLEAQGIVLPPEPPAPE